MEYGINCVDSPRVACDPMLDTPRCLDDMTFRTCIGSAQDGHFQLTILCSSCTDGVCTA